MSGTFKAWWATDVDGKANVALTDVADADLAANEVTVGVKYSTINYKDGLAVQGNKSKIMRSLPMAPGIDFAGVVEASDSADYAVGDEVVLTGWGVGEATSGGLSQRARAKANWLVKKPEGLTLQQTMAIGTAGFTAMMSVLALEDAGVKPGNGDIIVTGAAGGVGSVAVAVLAKLGYSVAASTGRESEHDYLRGLGATSIVPRSELSEPGRPLGREVWAGGIDTVGSQILVNILAATKSLGTVAVCGLAAGADLPGTVLPFILRGVRIWGIDSVYCPAERRAQAWARLATDLPLDKLDAITNVKAMADVPAITADILKGQVRGRTVIDVNT
ncbi:MAG: oxidoreductase [Alphaproteobacteria bacterium]|nr:oxidoreductase [Alphaproteobacteria bacterium]